MRFKPNDKVVCVDDSKRPLHQIRGYTYPDGRPVKDCVYCVIGMHEGIYNEGNGPFRGLAVIISGLRVFWYGEPDGWNPNRFRLVSEVGHPAIQIKEEQPA